MARLAIASAFGIVVGIVAGAALGSHAEGTEPSEDVISAAHDAQINESDLQGALNTLEEAYGKPIEPRTYLYAEGLLEPPYTPPTAARPTGVAPPSNARVACIESKESGGANVANRQGSGAVGVLQYMPSTFYSHAAEMGHFDWSPWNPAQARAVAAHDLALGRRGQWTVRGC